MNRLRQQNIANARTEVGWAYHDLLWFSEEEAAHAHQQRDELVRALSGHVKTDFQESKLYTGSLSPGCQICGNGGWGCNFVNALCTRHCFFCPQDRSVRKESLPMTDGFRFKDPADHIGFLRTFGIRGVGFSGGEPLLVLETLLAHIEAIRRTFGASMYLWVYTNGDRIDCDTLRALRKAGIDEIRVDVSARGYDLAPVALAKQYIPTTTVEIPAIPEDLDLVKRLLPEMAAIGITFLNLHQLSASEHNYQAFHRRRYHFLHQKPITVFESEICALKLLLHACECQTPLAVNYCCTAYRNRFQGRDIRMRQAKVSLKGFEETTSAGYIRSLQIRDSIPKIEEMVARFEGAHLDPGSWLRNEKIGEIAIHGALLPYVDWTSAEVALLYFEQKVALRDPSQGWVEGNLVSGREPVYQQRGWSRTALDCWHQMYVERANAKQALKAFCRMYPITGKDDVARLQEETARLKEIARWEELESGLPEVY